tara:strand:- start:116 stop:667 length:552 start_codon:yes stop_codon:yes gene_type:complete
MEIAEAIKKRRTIQIFSKRIVPNEVIEKSIVAANHAPCHKRTFPWRFTSIGMEKRELLYRLQLKLKFGDKPTDVSSLKKISDKMLNPSHLLVASQLRTDDQVQKLEDYAACACAIQNISLSLVADNVGCKWSTGRITKDPNTYSIVEINPYEEEIIGFIWIGYGTEPSLIKRPSMSTIFRYRD